MKTNNENKHAKYTKEIFQIVALVEMKKNDWKTSLPGVI